MNDHPDSLTLFSAALGEADEAVHLHVSSCRVCSDTVEQHQRDEGAAFARARAAYVRAPRLSAALAEPTPKPQADQLWRAEWDGVVQLVRLLQVDEQDDTVVAAPLVDAEAADDTSVTFGAELLGWTAAAVTSLSRDLPTRVLDRYLGQTGIAEPSLNRGTVRSATDERSHVYAVVQDRLDSLSQATWVMTDADETSLTEKLRQRWNMPGAMASDTGIGVACARELLEGVRPPSVDESASLSAAGIEAGVPAPPDSLVWAVDHPQVRHLWAADAAANGTTDSPSYRWEAYTNQRFALAARSTGRAAGSREAWLGIVREALGDSS